MAPSSSPRLLSQTHQRGSTEDGRRKRSSSSFMASNSLEEEDGRRFVRFSHCGKVLVVAPNLFVITHHSNPLSYLSRSLVQIKSHGQKVLKRADAGEDVWAPLREKPALVQKLVAKQAKSPRFIMPSIPYQASIARPRQVPKPKLKPRPVSTPEEPPLGVRFSVGNGRRENDSGRAVFRTQFGGTGNLSFSFRDAPQRVEDEESSAPPYSSDTFHPSDCRTPERPDPTMIKSTAVLAATALCQLSAGWDKKSSSDDHERVNIVSP